MNDDLGSRLIPLAAIRPSRSNPRKAFDETALAELTESVRAKGVLQPILVRPLLSPVASSKRQQKIAEGLGIAGDPRYELVCGERRLRAGHAAGLKVIPAVVRELTDLEALQVQVIENEQRTDLSPLEKAAGYQALVDAGLAVEALAVKVGKSPATIYGLLKLLALPPKARDALEAGTLPTSTAQLIARVPNEGLRQKVAGQVLSGQRYAYGAHQGEPLSYRDAQGLIRDKFMVELKQAPFMLKDVALLPEAGACTTCPKRTGNDRVNYPDGRADVCTDPECYRAKVAAYSERLVKVAKEEGKKVLSKEEGKKLFPYGNRLQGGSGNTWVDLKEQPYQDSKHRSWKQLVGAQLDAETVIAFDANGQPHRLVPKDRAWEIAKKEHGLKSGGYDSRANDSYRREQAKRQQEDKIKKEALRRCMGQVADKAEAIASRAVGYTPELVELLRLLLLGVVDYQWDDASRQVIKRRNLPRPAHAHSGGNRDSVAALVPTLDGPQLVGLLAEMIAARRGVGYYQDKGDQGFWAHFKVNQKAAEKEVRAELAGGKKAKAKKPAAAGTCRVCGCTEDDCRQCVEKTGRTCYWVEPGLCSACVEQGARAKTKGGKLSAAVILKEAKAAKEAAGV